MSKLILPERFSRQPDEPTAIDWDDPLTRGLRIAYNPRSRSEDVNGLRLLHAGQPRIALATASTAGLADRNHVYDGLYGLNNTTVTLPPSAMAWMRAGGVEATQFTVEYILVAPNTAAGNIFFDSPDAGQFFGSFDSYNQIIYWSTVDWYSDYAGLTNTAGDHAPSDHVIFSFDVSATGARNSYWKGVERTDYPWTVQSRVASAGFESYSIDWPETDSLVLNAPGTTTYLCLFRMWDRAISADEAQQLLDDPWRIYKSEDIVLYIPEAGGGATTHYQTVSASAASTITIAKAIASVKLSSSSANALIGKLLAATKTTQASGSATLARTVTQSRVLNAVAGAVASIATTATKSVALTAAATATASTVRRLAKLISTVASGTTTVVRSLSKLMAVSANNAAAFVRRPTKILIASSSGSATLARTATQSKVLIAIGGAAVSIGRAVTKIAALTTIATSTASVVRRLSKSISASASSTATFVRRLAKTISASSSGVATVTPEELAGLQYQTLSAVASGTAMAVRGVRKIAAITSSVSASIGKALSITKSVTTSAVVSIATRRPKALSAVVSSVASMSRISAQTVTMLAQSAAAVTLRKTASLMILVQAATNTTIQKLLSLRMVLVVSANARLNVVRGYVASSVALAASSLAALYISFESQIRNNINKVGTFMKNKLVNGIFTKSANKEAEF